MKILLANPRGFCAGVDRAITIVEEVLKRAGTPVYVRHEVVHNTFVVERLKAQGVIFVESLDAVPDGATVIFSAHGTPKRVYEEAAQRGLTVFDATCPLVTKVHIEVNRMAQAGIEIVMIGHAGHPEVEGTMGQCEGTMRDQIHLIETAADVERLQVRNPDRLGYVTQTTLSQDDAAQIVEALTRRFPRILAPKKEDICYATQNRQNAVRALTGEVDALVVVGSRNSSNSNRLRETAERRGIAAYRVDSAEELLPEWFDGKRCVGITAGASAPEVLVQEVVARLRVLGADEARECEGVIENVSFPLPKNLLVSEVRA
ncbi:MAG: 4-hydroxy-3-methylbut-2-enyl diphosphate reductase [Proteobacteria bacterium]|nr:4-hydroxy-3-methylbut-2-enyl diphosphate reductase [Pseudomonadota bacterium]MCL2307106.1 4-hydroxy-3-methylbut-2-enyl diphosphate reductase [Pseudomonadota bacterium]